MRWVGLDGLLAGLLAVCLAGGVEARGQGAGAASRSVAAAKPDRAVASPDFAVASPDGRIVLRLAAPGGALQYRVTMDGRDVLEPSALGIESNGDDVGAGVTLGAVQRRRVHEQYRFWGAHAIARNDANEATVRAASHGEAFLVDVHVADDGVAVRLRLKARRGRRVEADRSAWSLPGDPLLWGDKLDPAYESPYHTSSLAQTGTEALGLPITGRLAGGVYVTMTEAAVRDYGDMAVRLGADHALHGELYADPGGWSTDAAVVQPWRVTVMARTLTALVNTTMVENLNPAPSAAMARATWIRPGRSTWQWLSSGDPVESEQRQWVDWTAQLEFPYYLVDEGWSAWKDLWGGVAKVVAYARSRHVAIWVWVHSKEVTDAAARRAYFQRAAALGIAGVKIDFPPPSSRVVADWYWQTAEDAARAHLMVDFHGATKPTGLSRTWPNVLTREGVRGHEWHITRYHRVLEADHDVILPFTRYIAGPGDYTPTVFPPTELMGNTWAHELAQSVVFTSPFLCFGGAPATYLANPALDVLKAVAPVWDETRVLPGSEPGVVVAEARRAGDRWLIAVMNGGTATDVMLPMDFLAAGPWKSVELRDAEGRPDAFDRTEGTVTAASEVTLHLRPRGGFVALLRR